MRECSFERFTDADLLAEMKRLTARERAATADLLQCLMEVDARRLYLREACSSLFTYCTQVLHLAEGAAYNRIEAARAARRFPAVLDAIEDGSITLTSARLLAPHLTVENHRRLLDAVRHRSKRDVERLIASLHPRPPVPSTLQKLPAPRQSTFATDPVASEVSVPNRPTEHPSVVSSARAHSGQPDAGEQRQAVTPGHRTGPRVEPPQRARHWSRRCRRAGTHSRSPSRTKRMQSCAAQDLLRHSIPDGDLAAVLDRALTRLLENEEKRRCGSASRPRVGTSTRRAHAPHSCRGEAGSLAAR